MAQYSEQSERCRAQNTEKILQEDIIFDRNIVQEKLHQTAYENKDLDDGIHRNWTELAGEACLSRR